MRLREFFYLHKSDRQVLLTFQLVAVLVMGAIFALELTGEREEELMADEPLPQRDTLMHHVPYSSYDVARPKAERFPFDPNTADSTQLLRLGLEPWQVRNIYKYRAAGGIFRKKEDFARVYGLTQKMYRELEPYIRISADYQPASLLVKEEKQEHDTLLFPQKIAEGETVDLAVADTSELKTVPGIGSYFARKIVDYRERLGGYVSVEQLDEIDGFPLQAKKYLRLGEMEVRKLNLNTLSLSELRRHPYLNYYQARTIVEYRRKKGALKSLDDLRLSRDFPPEARQRLLPYVEF
jgi:DNA uptake protein ComE-like DNA-binding protein